MIQNRNLPLTSYCIRVRQGLTKFIFYQYFPIASQSDTVHSQVYRTLHSIKIGGGLLI